MRVFFNRVLAISAGMLCILVMSFIIFNFSNLYLYSISLGWFLSFLYVISGFILFYFAIKSTVKSFSRFMALSIFGRLGLLSISIILIIKFTVINNIAFLIALFGFYLIFQILEVFELNKYTLKGA